MSDRTENLTVLVVEPMRKPQVREITGDLGSMQAVVGGAIELVYPFPEDPVALICHEEGKLIGLPPNRFLRLKNGQPYDVICGTFFLAGVEEDRLVSLRREQLEKYSSMYSREVLLQVPRDKGPGRNGRRETDEQFL